MSSRDVVSRGVLGKKLVAPTYDDGPTYPEATREIVAVLQKAKAKATFFVRGCMAVVNSEVLKDVHAAAMEIGNHTFNHPDLALYNPSQSRSRQMIKEEIFRTHEVVKDLIGFSMRQFRAPWGRTNDFVKRIMDTDSDLGPLNYNSILWSVDSEDYKSGRGADEIFAKVTKEPDLDGAIVLMHDGAIGFTTCARHQRWKRPADWFLGSLSEALIW